MSKERFDLGASWNRASTKQKVELLAQNPALIELIEKGGSKQTTPNNNTKDEELKRLVDLLAQKPILVDMIINGGNNKK